MWHTYMNSAIVDSMQSVGGKKILTKTGFLLPYMCPQSPAGFAE